MHIKQNVRTRVATTIAIVSFVAGTASYHPSLRSDALVRNTPPKTKQTSGVLGDKSQKDERSTSTSNSGPVGTSSPPSLTQNPSAIPPVTGAPVVASRSSSPTAPSTASHRLVFTPEVTTINAYGSGDQVHMVADDGAELGQPEVTLPNTLRIEWRDDGTGHKLSGPFWAGWIGWVMRASPESGGDSLLIISAKDRSGNVYQGQLRVIWPAERYIYARRGSVTKQTSGDTVSYTARVLLEAGPTFGSPKMHIYTITHGGTSCGSGATDVTFSYDGRQFIDVVCSFPISAIQNAPYGAIFDVPISAEGINQRYVVNYAGDFTVYYP